MVAGGNGGNAALALIVGQGQHFVYSAPNLKAFGPLEGLRLEEIPAAFAAQIEGFLQRRLADIGTDALIGLLHIQKGK